MLTASEAFSPCYLLKIAFLLEISPNVKVTLFAQCFLTCVSEHCKFSLL